MITCLAQCIVDLLVSQDIIDRKHLDVYIYGFEITISSIINILIALILGAISHEILQVIIFVIVFISMRKFSGGYHADTYLKCNTLFAINIALIIIYLKFCINHNQTLHILINLFTISSCILFSPMTNKNKPLSNWQKTRCKKTSILICTIWCILSTICFYYKIIYYLVIDMALFCVCLSMIIEKINRSYASLDGN